MEAIEAAFSSRFGTIPATVVRAPGRVNLIGEHTDYSLLPVLPMAINRAVTVPASATDDGRVVIEMRPDLAPWHIARIKELTRNGFYDGLVRVGRRA